MFRSAFHRFMHMVRGDTCDNETLVVDLTESATNTASDIPPAIRVQMVEGLGWHPVKGTRVTDSGERLPSIVWVPPDDVGEWAMAHWEERTDA